MCALVCLPACICTRAGMLLCIYMLTYTHTHTCTYIIHTYTHNVRTCTHTHNPSYIHIHVCVFVVAHVVCNKCLLHQCIYHIKISISYLTHF